MRFFNKSAAPIVAQAIHCDIGSGSIDFHALLREAVRSVNDTHQEAVDDLLALCAQLNAAVTTLSDQALHINLVEITDTPDGVAYELRLHDQTTALYNFHMYKVPVSGYPITYGSRGAGSKFSGFEAQCLHRLSLEQHFAALLTDVHSPLVVQVSFALRKATRCPWPQAA